VGLFRRFFERMDLKTVLIDELGKLFRPRS
jgi:hypothetical protein